MTGSTGSDLGGNDFSDPRDHGRIEIEERPAQMGGIPRPNLELRRFLATC